MHLITKSFMCFYTDPLARRVYEEYEVSGNNRVSIQTRSQGGSRIFSWYPQGFPVSIQTRSQGGSILTVFSQTLTCFYTDPLARRVDVTKFSVIIITKVSIQTRSQGGSEMGVSYLRICCFYTDPLARRVQFQQSR